MDSETFAERISRLTGAARMTDADLASVLGVSENQAKRIKSGTTSTLKLDGALRLARRLGVTPHYLAGEPEPPPIDFRDVPTYTAAHEVRLNVLDQTTMPAEPTNDRILELERNAIRPVGRESVTQRFVRVEAQAAEVPVIADAMEFLRQAVAEIVSAIELPTKARRTIEERLQRVAAGPS